MPKQNRGNFMRQENVLRVALYPRVSTEEQVLRGYSLEAQEEALVRYAAENNMKVVGIYRDEGHSARKPALKRPVMQDLLADVRAGKIDRILFIKLDRWFRNVREYHKVQAILEENNVTWQATMEDYNTATADGRLKVNIMLSVAENESDRTSERIKFVFESKRRKKEVCFGGNNMPYGYMAQTIDGARRLVKNPETAPILEDFWDHFRKYQNIRLAALFVNEKYGINRSYKNWTDIAKNEIYTGVYRGIPDFCPAYISHEEWISLREPYAQIKTTRNPDRVYLFTGLLVCNACGKRLKATFCTRRKPTGDVEYRSYRCNDKVLCDCPCNSNISEIKLEKYLLANIRADLEHYVFDIEAEQSIPKKNRPELDIAKLRERMRRLNIMYMDGNIDDDEYRKTTADLKEKIETAKQREKEDRPPNIEFLNSFLQSDFETIYKGLPPEDKRRMWRAIISEICIERNSVKSIKFRA